MLKDILKIVAGCVLIAGVVFLALWLFLVLFPLEDLAGVSGGSMPASGLGYIMDILFNNLYFISMVILFPTGLIIALIAKVLPDKK